MHRIGVGSGTRPSTTFALRSGTQARLPFSLQTGTRGDVLLLGLRRPPSALFRVHDVTSMKTNPLQLSARAVQHERPFHGVKRIVITGGTHSGKSTVIQHMRMQGWETLDEAAAFVINRKSAEIGSEGCKDWMDSHFSAFQDQIFDRQVDIERACQPPPGVLLTDRSGIDCIAYLRSRKLTPPNAMIAYAKHSAYFRVFLFDTLQSFTTSYADSIAMRDCLLETYRSYGYEPITVPELPILDRCDFLSQFIANPRKASPFGEA